jgi:hypothetical protein
VQILFREVETSLDRGESRDDDRHAENVDELRNAQQCERQPWT